MKSYLKTITALAALAVMTLGNTGCAVVDHQIAKNDLEKTTNDVESQYALAARSPISPRVTDSEGVWVNKHSVTTREDHLPAAFRSDVGISFAGKSSLKDVTTLITRSTGMRISFAPDVVAEATAPLLNAGFVSDCEMRALLDRITSQADMSWRYSEGSVEIYRFETKVYQLAIIPGITTITSSASNKNESGQASTGGAASSGQEAKYTTTTDMWKGINDDLKGLVGKDSAYSVSQSSGTLTVTGRPQVQSAVSSYVKNMNAMRTRQVMVEVHAYTVEVDNSRDFGMSLSNVFSNLNTGLGLTAVTAATAATGVGLLTAALSPSSSSKWANSKVVLSALSTLGNTSVAAEASGMVLSGESLPINQLHEVTYLAQVSSTANSNASPTVSLTPGTTSEGFSMQVTPTIVGGDFISIVGAIDISTINKLTTYTSGGQSITAPDRSTGSIPLKMGLKSGETYVFGLRQNTSSVNDSGLAGTSILATPFGGDHSSSVARKSIVVTVTPYIINPAN
jgi:type IVB pilus formation R64 PilN family outer membrane protein